MQRILDSAYNMETTQIISESIQMHWTAFVDRYHDNTLLIWVLIPYFCSISANIIVSLIGEILDRVSPQFYYDRYKIVYKQETALSILENPETKVKKFARPQLSLFNGATFSLISQFALFISSFTGLVLFPLFITPTDEIPNFIKIALTMYAMSIVDDLWFYWNHRALHNVKWLWENVHAFHHQIKEPTGLATNYIHPLEMLLVSVGPFLAAIVFRPPLFVLYLYIFIRTGVDIANHTGWEFPFSPLRFLPFHTQTKFHDTHHYISGYYGNAKNLATTSTIWDKVFGTYSINESLVKSKK